MTYDGSSRAGGLRLYRDGRRAECDVVRDALTKNITGGGGDELTVGQRFRDRGFKNGLVDEINVFDRTLTPLEVAQLGDGTTLRNALSRDPAELTPAARQGLFAYYLANFDAEYIARLADLKELRRKRSTLVDPVAEIMVMKELPQPRPAFVLRRGAYDAPAERVSRETPAALLPFAPDWPRNRLGLARWVTDPKQPLTARVTVNRWWQSIFGRGIVATPEDFGSQGQLPSHPELLDWLARQFIDSGWDVKNLWRQIVTSATYRQASEASAELQSHDPDNVLLGRGPRLRLAAEMIRDTALAASGLLAGKVGGPPVKPYQPAGLWEEKANISYVRDVGEGSHRRSVYTFWKRTSPPPAMLTFDATSREVSPSSVCRRQPRSRPWSCSTIPSTSRPRGHWPSGRYAMEARRFPIARPSWSACSRDDVPASMSCRRSKRFTANSTMNSGRDARMLKNSSPSVMLPTIPVSTLPSWPHSPCSPRRS